MTKPKDFIFVLAIITLSFFLFFTIRRSDHLKQERDQAVQELKAVQDSLAALPDSIVFVFSPNKRSQFTVYPGDTVTIDTVYLDRAELR